TKDAVKAALGKLSGPDATADTALEGLKTTIADRKLAEEGTPAAIAALSDDTRKRVNPYLTPDKLADVKKVEDIQKLDVKQIKELSPAEYMAARANLTDKQKGDLAKERTDTVDKDENLVSWTFPPSGSDGSVKAEYYTGLVLTKITTRVNGKDVIEFTDFVDGKPESVVFRTDDGTFIAEGRRDANGAWTDKWIDEKGNLLPDSVRPLLAGLAPRAEPSERAALSAFLAEAIPAEAALEAALEAAELELRTAFDAYKTGDDAGLDGLRTARDKLKEQVDNRSKHWKKLVGIATDKGASEVAVSAIMK
ncbi:hypothetical protein M8997_022100, partial [Phyllobacterium sp. 21LDTY02-6]|uniref:hypothetical protein n=1 Tax=Phyllobacterium sp. 21LDTY02-6 TaxID=2944903 RepID=UPI00208E78C1